MSKDFNIYKWRRDYLNENESNSIGTYYDRPGKFKGKDYDGYVRLYGRTSDKDVDEEFEKKGYTEVGFETRDAESDRKASIYVYYTK